jgi:hypothetical protein
MGFETPNEERTMPTVKRRSFERLLAAADVRLLRLPARSPNLKDDGFTPHLLRSIRRDVDA